MQSKTKRKNAPTGISNRTNYKTSIRGKGWNERRNARYS